MSKQSVSTINAWMVLPRCGRPMRHKGPLGHGPSQLEPVSKGEGSAPLSLGQENVEVFPARGSPSCLTATENNRVGYPSEFNALATSGVK
jgi:hypothetical protein